MKSICDDPVGRVRTHRPFTAAMPSSRVAGQTTEAETEHSGRQLPKRAVVCTCRRTLAARERRPSPWTGAGHGTRKAADGGGRGEEVLRAGYCTGVCAPSDQLRAPLFSDAGFFKGEGKRYN